MRRALWVVLIGCTPTLQHQASGPNPQDPLILEEASTSATSCVEDCTRSRMAEAIDFQIIEQGCQRTCDAAAHLVRDKTDLFGKHGQQVTLIGTVTLEVALPPGSLQQVVTPGLILADGTPIAWTCGPSVPPEQWTHKPIAVVATIYDHAPPALANEDAEAKPMPGLQIAECETPVEVDKVLREAGLHRLEP